MKEIFNVEEFEKEINSRNVLVEFYAPWCGPCKIQKGILERANLQSEPILVDIDKLVELREKYNINSVPTIIVFTNKEEIVRLVGVQSLEKLLKIQF